MIKSLWPLGGRFFNSTSKACKTVFENLRKAGSLSCNTATLFAHHKGTLSQPKTSSPHPSPWVPERPQPTWSCVPLTHGHVVEQALDLVNDNHALGRLVGVLKHLVDLGHLGKLRIAHHVLGRNHFNVGETGAKTGRQQRPTSSPCDKRRVTHFLNMVCISVSLRVRAYHPPEITCSRRHQPMLYSSVLFKSRGFSLNTPWPG